MIRPLATVLLVSAALLGCKSKSSDSKAPPTTAAKPNAEEPKPEPAKPEPAKPAGPPEAKLAAAETLAIDPQIWKTPGGDTTLAVIVTGDHAVLRAYFGDQHLDLMAPIDATSDMTYFLTPDTTGATVHFRARALVGRVPEAGALFAFDDFQISWDAAAAKPVVSQQWSCDETEAKDGECNGPAWTEDAAPSAADTELPDDECCCEATFVDEKTDKESVQHLVMGQTACERKTDDGKCVDRSLCP